MTQTRPQRTRPSTVTRAATTEGANPESKPETSSKPKPRSKPASPALQIRELKSPSSPTLHRPPRQGSSRENQARNKPRKRSRNRSLIKAVRHSKSRLRSPPSQTRQRPPHQRCCIQSPPSPQPVHRRAQPTRTEKPARKQRTTPAATTRLTYADQNSPSSSSPWRQHNPEGCDSLTDAAGRRGRMRKRRRSEVF